MAGFGLAWMRIFISSALRAEEAESIWDFLQGSLALRWISLDVLSFQGDNVKAEEIGFFFKGIHVGTRMAGTPFFATRISLHSIVVDLMPARLHLTSLRLKRWPFRLRATLLRHLARFNLNCRALQDSSLRPWLWCDCPLQKSLENGGV